MQRQEIVVNVNGESRELWVRCADTLLDVLRRDLGLTGAKPGCENGDCGACTVIVNDTPYKSCIMLAVEADGERVMTIEGLRDTAIQRAFATGYAFQCGYCTPGFIMNAYALLQETTIDEYTIQEWLESNICRCTSYEEIGEVVRNAVMYRDTGTLAGSDRDRSPNSED